MKIWQPDSFKGSFGPSFLAVCETIAMDLGLRLENSRAGGARTPWVAFTLRVAVPLPGRTTRKRYEEGRLSYKDDQKYQSDMRFRGKSIHMGRERWKNCAVCWHGHKAFLDRLVGRYPDLRFESKLWKFRGAEEYHAKVAATGMVNVGSLAYPVQAREACDCYGG